MTGRHVRNAIVVMLVVGSTAVATGRAAEERGRINLGGIVTEGYEGGFTLDAGRTSVRVDMNEWEWYEDYSVLEDQGGTNVMVFVEQHKGGNSIEVNDSRQPLAARPVELET